MDKISSPIKERVIKYLEYRHVTRESFCRTTGIAASNFKGIGRKSELGGDKIAKILAAFPELNSEWLLTGRGPMLVAGDPMAGSSVDYPPVGDQQPVHAGDVSGEYHLGRETAGATPGIPLFELGNDGLAALFGDAKHRTPIDRLSLPGLPLCDGALYVRGDAMAPVLKSGDIVLYKEISNIPGGIQWGEMYLLSFEIDGEEHVVVRSLRPGSDSCSVQLAGLDPAYPAQEIPWAAIRALAIVKASVRYNTMG